MSDTSIQLTVVNEPQENWLIVPLSDHELLLNKAQLGIQRAPFAILAEIVRLVSPDDRVIFESQLDTFGGSDLEQLGQKALRA